MVVSDLDKWKEFSREIFLDENLYNLTFVWSPKLVDDNRFLHVFVLDGDVKEFIENIKKENLFIDNDMKAEVIGFTFDDKTINMRIESESSVPVLIKFSYYPTWKGNTNVYLASPSLMLVYAKGNIELRFT